MPIIYKRSESPVYDLSSPHVRVKYEGHGHSVNDHERDGDDDDELDFLTSSSHPFNSRPVEPPLKKSKRDAVLPREKEKMSLKKQVKKQERKEVLLLPRSSPPPPPLARQSTRPSNAPIKPSTTGSRTKRAASTKSHSDRRFKHDDPPPSSSGRSIPTPSTSPRDPEPSLVASQRSHRAHPQHHARRLPPPELSQHSKSKRRQRPTSREGDTRASSLIHSSAEKELRPRRSLHPPDRELKLPSLELGASRATSKRQLPIPHPRPSLPTPSRNEPLTSQPRRSEAKPRRASASDLPAMTAKDDVFRGHGHGRPTPTRPKAAIKAASERRNIHASAPRPRKRSSSPLPEPEPELEAEPEPEQVADHEEYRDESSPPPPPFALARTVQNASPPSTSAYAVPTSSPNRTPDVLAFLEALPLPLGHLAPTLAAFGLRSRADLLALAARTEGGEKARQVMMDELEQRGELTPWQRIVVEAELEVGARTWNV